MFLKGILPSARKHCKFASATAKTYWLGKSFKNVLQDGQANLTGYNQLARGLAQTLKTTATVKYMTRFLIKTFFFVIL